MGCQSPSTLVPVMRQPWRPAGFGLPLGLADAVAAGAFGSDGVPGAAGPGWVQALSSAAAANTAAMGRGRVMAAR